jgi:putative transposase
MRRSHFSRDQIVDIVRSVATGRSNVAGVLREHGISAATYFRWRKRYIAEIGAEGARRAELEERVARLTRTIERQNVEIAALRALLREFTDRGRPPPRGATVARTFWIFRAPCMPHRADAALGIPLSAPLSKMSGKLSHCLDTIVRSGSPFTGVPCTGGPGIGTLSLRVRLFAISHSHNGSTITG